MSQERSEIIDWAADKLRGLVPQIEEDMARAKALCLRPGGSRTAYEVGQIRYPEEVMLHNLTYLRGSVVSIAEALSSNPKLKGKDDNGMASTKDV